MWGNVNASSYLSIPTTTRQNELYPSYTFPISGPYLGRGDAFQAKVPIDSWYTRFGQDTRMTKKACDVLSGISIDRSEYLSCNPQDPYSNTPTYIVWGGYSTRNAREPATQANCPGQNWPTDRPNFMTGGPRAL